MTADRNELDMTELDLRELLEAAGGAAYDAAVELAKYIEELCVKYNCVDKGYLYLMKVCTPEEKEKIKMMRKAVYSRL